MSAPRQFLFSPSNEKIEKAVNDIRPYIELLAQQNDHDPKVCWEWPTGHLKNPYGQFQGIPAHRLSWIAVNGPIPLPTKQQPHRMIVRHMCNNPPCVNPHHLVLGTYSDNKRDRSYPIVGHVLSQEPGDILAEMQRKSNLAKAKKKA